SVSHFLQYRALPVSVRCLPVRVASPQLGQTTWRFAILMGVSRSRMPPLTLRCGLARVCFLPRFTRSTMAVPLDGFTRSTFPCLPRSLPERTRTVSFFLTCGLTYVSSFFEFALPYIVCLRSLPAPAR